MPFKRGQSGNPGGRPKAAADVVQLARKRTSQNLKQLAYWADQREDGSVAMRAAIALHEIAWGKPAQSMDFKGSVDVPLGALLQKIRRDAPKP